MANARKQIKQTVEIVAEGKKLSHVKENLDGMGSIEKAADTQLQLIDQLEKTILTTVDTYEKKMRPIGQNFTGMLQDLIGKAVDLNNKATINQTAAAMNSMAAVRALFGRFAYNRTQDNAEQTGRALEDIAKNMEAIKATLASEDGKALFAEIQKSYTGMTDPAAVMREAALESIKLTLQIRQLNGDVMNFASKINSNVDDNMNQQGAATVQVNDSAQATMLGGAGIGGIVGILVAVFIILGLVKVLSDMSVFANAISTGDFQARMDVREKGEVGATIAAMRRIPEVLTGMVQSAVGVTAAIRHGRFDTRLDVDRFSGEFSHLATAINAVGESYDRIIDNFPPLMSCDKDCKILYLNKPAQTILGGNLKGQNCGQLLKAPECGTANCVGKQALEKGSFRGETQVHPQGKTIDVSVSGACVRDDKGAAIG
jgi:HAMP domain-containing protein